MKSITRKYISPSMRCRQSCQFWHGPMGSLEWPIFQAQNKALKKSGLFWPGPISPNGTSSSGRTCPVLTLINQLPSLFFVTNQSRSWFFRLMRVWFDPGLFSQSCLLACALYSSYLVSALRGNDDEFIYIPSNYESYRAC